MLPATIPSAGLREDQVERGILPSFLHIHGEQELPWVGCIITGHGTIRLQLLVVILNDPAEPGFKELSLDQTLMLADLSGT